MDHWAIGVFIIWTIASLCGPGNLAMMENYPNQESITIEYHSIGEFHSKLTPKTGAPRQGALQPDNQATIKIFEDFVPALRDLKKYEYIIVLYHMHLSENWHPDVRPPGSKRARGLFATRSPNRPNPIGFGVIKLKKITGNILYVSGIDAFDGSPVLDIKPWIPSIDCPTYTTDNDILLDLEL